MLISTGLNTQKNKVRNPNSGSQEKMETIVMAGLTMIDWPEMVGYVMLAPYFQLGNDENGHVMASVRADIDKLSTAYQLFYQLATGQHNSIAKESGYIVYK